MTAQVAFIQILPPGPAVVAGLTGDPSKLSLAGGWTSTARPKRVAITEWAGWDPVTLTIPIILDGYIDERSVEGEIGLLQQFCRSLPNGVQPPVLSVQGPVPGTDLRWALSSIDWGDELRRDDGQRIRALGTVSLLEYNGVDLAVLAAPPPSPAAAAVAVAAPAGGSTGGRTYTVKRGDTLSAIAQRELGNSARWHEIADLNGIRDPRALGVGQVLRIP